MSKSLIRNLRHQYQLYSQQEKCCICGMNNCDESVDHEKVTLEEISQLMNIKFINQDKIAQIKRKISQIYKEIKFQIFELLEKDQYQLQKYINKFNFPANLSKQMDTNLLTLIMENNIESLPSRKIIKLVKRLQKMPQIQESEGFEDLKQKGEKLFQNFNFSSILSELKANLPLKYFSEEPRELKLKPKTSISQITNPEETDYANELKVYQWRNVRVTKNSRTVSLSNKNISDREVMEQIPILANYKNLKQFQIRNNKISCLTCNLIANNMPFLISVDIRGNNINDKGILKLIRGIPKIKSFFISQTLATDVSGQEVVKKLNDLEMFWSQHTKISNQVALKIAQKPKIKVLSLVGNPIDDQYKQKMKKLFISKGYIAI